MHDDDDSCTFIVKKIKVLRLWPSLSVPSTASAAASSASKTSATSSAASAVAAAAAPIATATTASATTASTVVEAAPAAAASKTSSATASTAAESAATTTSAAGAAAASTCTTASLRTRGLRQEPRKRQQLGRVDVNGCIKIRNFFYINFDNKIILTSVSHVTKRNNLRNNNTELSEFTSNIRQVQ
ncbi:1,4-alpha-glucan branching enzyme GlgB [Frankliniella fusca]|uniref:1,4-alpha-glucan branching enzyme GlgB n=1 Tax=Frankliniella fusca TaxID=407009 RepID=A0AAE1I237_9NEOP|nr:1,4-alpha-glucan branching enzyme GlgB [Frankliniella fusca]